MNNTEAADHTLQKNEESHTNTSQTVEKLPQKSEKLHEKDSEKIKGPEQFPGESDGPKGPEPTRYGDWEKNGRVSDF